MDRKEYQREYAMKHREKAKERLKKFREKKETTAETTPKETTIKEVETTVVKQPLSTQFSEVHNGEEFLNPFGSWPIRASKWITEEQAKILTRLNKPVVAGTGYREKKLYEDMTQIEKEAKTAEYAEDRARRLAKDPWRNNDPR